MLAYIKFVIAGILIFSGIFWVQSIITFLVYSIPKHLVGYFLVFAMINLAFLWSKMLADI